MAENSRRKWLTRVSAHFFSASGVTVRDLGRFTIGGNSPYCMLIPLDAVFALVRQHWIYESFSEYHQDLDSVTVVKLRSRHNSRSVMRLIWDNKGAADRSQAKVLDEGEWSDSKYGKKLTVHHSLTDVRVLIRNNGRVLAFL